MKIKVNYTGRQVCCILIILFTAVSCYIKKGDTPVTPPLSSPLSQEYIGFGVINVSYTRVTEDPSEDSSSPGYLRQGTVVRIHERKLINTNGKTEAWLLIEESCKGWLKETLVDIYDNESQAKTAAESISK